MMNQGAGAEPLTALDSSNFSQKYQGMDASQGHAALTSGHHTWSSSAGPVSVSWNSYGTDTGPIEHATPPSSSYQYDSQREMSVQGDAQDGMNSASHASTSSTAVAANVTQQYASYAPYSAPTHPYAYSNTEYQNYYGYQQPANSSSYQQVGAGQNSGAPYQSFSSFQHTGSYVAPQSYSGTYYNAGDHQTTAGYPNSSYVDQSNSWNNGSCGNYAQYSNYTTADTHSTQSATTLPANSHHYQQYGQWPSYYNPAAPAVSCAPGTENALATAASTPTYPVQATNGSYPYPSSQPPPPPPPGTTSWRRDSGTSGLPFMQDKSNTTAYNQNGAWEVAAPGSQNYQLNQMSSHLEKPLDPNPGLSVQCEDQQKTTYSQGSCLQPPSNQNPENFQPHLQTSTTIDTRRVSKMQIPTNPRIASSLALGMSKVDKESSTTNAAMKPAYFSVPVPKPSNQFPSHDDAESIIKGTFPTSLRAYVERTFARCKDDSQRAANQNLMKEMITKASTDGSLFTKNWDVEPLFALPNSTLNAADQNAQSSVTASILPKFKRSPNRRTKSRWEPIADEKLAEKLASISYDSPKVASWDQFKGTERVTDTRKFENKDKSWNGINFLTTQQQTPLSKITQRPMKKPRFADTTNVTENGDASSDSDKEQGLTKYYSSAIALANSPEEKKRREDRCKRFDKGQESQAEIKHYRPKMTGAGNTYTRKANAVLLAKTNEDNCSRAVEDMDWDALTVRGTCQEVEKRYLRLTSAPDPATVRPEEVLEKALRMVQTCQKNYLYKCDQLKSIRQDLTVQRIQNELTVKVYETHARLALEAGDLPEYNQCQSQLKSLYAEGIKGCHMEFSAYNLLCVILHSNNNRDLVSAMTRLSIEAKEDEAVKHALAVRSAVTSGNYILFFRLYRAAPNLNTCLMDLCVEKIRFEAIKCISKSYRPTVPVNYIARSLGFLRSVQTEAGEDKDTSGLDECEEWLKAHGAVLTVDSNGEVIVDTKASSSNLYMPEPEDAVAHGDANLALNDFFTRTTS